MKEYNIEVEEILRKVVPVKSKNIEDAINLVDDKINKEEIVLDYADFKERNIHNLHSKALDKSLNFHINYNSNTELLTIKCGDISKQYSADTVIDIKSCLSLFIDDYIEEPEIEALNEKRNASSLELLEDNEIDLDERD